MLIILISGCKNPFAPKLDFSSGSSGSILADQKTVDGVFQNFQYAYTFKDTTIYGKLISGDFNFTYVNYNLTNPSSESWGRDEEMKTTYGLFENTQRLDLIWNNIVLSSQDSLSANIIRSFNLTITFSPTDVIRLDGRVNLALRKNPESGIWVITQWIDETAF